jgi:hypothetical protein
MREIKALLLALMCASITPSAHAQSPDQAVIDPSPAPAAASVRTGTVVELAFVDPISSKTAKQGETFALKLALPIKDRDAVLVPAGALGQGEVIDAGKGGFGGKPGKLVLAARFLMVDGQQMELRGLKLGVGEDTYDAVLAVSLIPYVGLASLFMTGGNVEIPAGTPAHAKVSADFTIPPAPAAPLSDVKPESMTNEGTP